MSYPKLRGAIREKFGTQAAFAKALGVNQATLVKKLAGKTEWKVAEVQAACELLEIPVDRISDYFFAD
jgi:DNA-binding XRE family transcriptional regulator